MFPDFRALVLENGEVWALYGRTINETLYLKGFMHSLGAWNGDAYQSSDAKDFGYDAAASASIAAQYNRTTQALTGTVTGSESAVNFSSVPIAANLYDYAKPAQISYVAGRWQMTDMDGYPVVADIDASGNIAAATNYGCRISGRLTPRASGKNVFDVALNLGAAPCPVPNTSAKGVVVSYPTAAGKQQTIVVAYSPDRVTGFGAIGDR